ncbi:sugar-binding transcriptional regulator [Vagococcus salmoninarum]|uniref:sugar-binding transcriptional regulator n=1 Tax=Vagococcus salmoninarum TaxID=2739 RepID=UPI0018826B18|nr:sugar-binding domain-containing protein [Vagococcus salmoninarum]MBE9388467.1 sugar-binding transcriptional regulator [Vagococcus salmoninarum]
MKLTEERRKLLKVVSLYYNQGLTQAVIAKQLGVSRPVISKLLQTARADGIVKIHINDEDALRVDQALILRKRYHLNDVLVIPVKKDRQESVDALQQRVAQASASWLVEQLPRIQSIGLSWGTTLAAVIEAMPYVTTEKMVVRPLVGGVASEHVFYDTNHLVFRLAEKLGSRCSYFYAPALAESQALAEALNASQLVANALGAAREVDLAIIGVGNPQEHSTWQNLGYFSQGQVIASDIVGDGVASLFDKNGQTVDNIITKRMIGLKVEELSRIKEVLVIGTGQEKAVSIQSLLKGQGVTAMIIDSDIAEALIKMER